LSRKAGRSRGCPPDAASPLALSSLHYFGTLGGLPCLCGRMDREKIHLPFERINLRKFYHRADDRFRQAVSCGRMVADLHAKNRFCGCCAGRTRALEKEYARKCPSCGIIFYPRISPAVIMAVTRGDEILLARGVNFPNKKMFSVLAGFVSPAETLEACVVREVFEETCIRVRDITYVESQPWPFPDSLMIGFTATYDTGEIQIDPEEIEEASWFKANSLPLIPDEYTLAGRLIRTFAAPLTGKGGESVATPEI